MALTAIEKDDFSNAYLQFLVKNWTDEDFSAKTESNPREALAEAGIELPADAEIEVITHTGDDADAYTEAGDHNAAMKAQVALFEEGRSTGNYRFHLPATPNVSTEDMDSLELSAITAGSGCCCCCCSC